MSAPVDTISELFDLGPLEIKPPIYLAGDWTQPPYALILMEPDLDHEGLYGWTYTLEVVIPFGNHRYRYWAPDWGDWIWNEAIDTGQILSYHRCPAKSKSGSESDEDGDEYNIINVPSSISNGGRSSEDCLSSQPTSLGTSTDSS